MSAYIINSSLHDLLHLEEMYAETAREAVLNGDYETAEMLRKKAAQYSEKIEAAQKLPSLLAQAKAEEKALKETQICLDTWAKPGTTSHTHYQYILGSLNRVHAYTLSVLRRVLAKQITLKIRDEECSSFNVKVETEEPVNKA